MIALQNHVLVTIVFCSLCKCQEDFEFRSKEYKHILLWDEPDVMPMSLFMSGAIAFQQYNCPVSKCYVTSNKDFFHGSLAGFEAIVFNGQSSCQVCASNRFEHQKYIYASMKPESKPICNTTFDGFYNWTASYRLNSDFIFPFIVMANATGHIAGPRSDTKWQKDMKATDAQFARRLHSKKKLAAWFVANCTATHRNEFVQKLQEALQKLHLSIDIFGPCGKHNCAKSQCTEILKRDYFFYLALESIKARDYVTEKIIPALQNYVVPIVYGETDYSRFLPPHSYLNGKEMSAEELASKMKDLMESPSLYKDYFKWRRYYRFSASSPVGATYKGKGICQICEALHNEERKPTKTVVKDFRRWLDPNFEQKCGIPAQKKYKLIQKPIHRPKNKLTIVMRGENETGADRIKNKTTIVIELKNDQVSDFIPPPVTRPNIKVSIPNSSFSYVSPSRPTMIPKNTYNKPIIQTSSSSSSIQTKTGGFKSTYSFLKPPE